MAKAKGKKSRVSHKTHSHVTHSHSYAHDDKALMLLAAAAALVVGFFAIFAYKSQSVMMLPSPTPMVEIINLDTQNKSGETGTATLQEVNGKVVVTLAMTGFVKGVSQPAHIHLGSCPNPGAIKYPLTSVVNGTSETTLDVSMSELKAMGTLALNVHKSVPQSSVYVACGNL